MESAPKPRVLIAGGSISGQFLAVALQSANIDFLVLERGPEIGPQLGASVGCHPHGNSIFDQLGLYEAVVAPSTPLAHAQAFDNRGNVVESDITVISEHPARFGYPAVFIQRCDFITAMYNKVRDKSKVLVNKAIVDYIEDDEGITVYTSDGSNYRGTILIGADGIHSTVRGLMKKKAEEAEPGSGTKLETTNNGKPGFLTEYKCLFCISRTNDKECPMPAGESYWTYGRDNSTTAVSGQPGLFFWFLWTRTDPVQGIRSPRYTEKDAEEFVQQWSNRKMCGDWTIRDAWNARVRGTLVSQEEGIIDQWSRGRVVMVGDAIHKMSVNAGLGAMCAVEGIVHLINELYPILSPNSTDERHGGSPSQDTLDKAFQAYRTKHLKRLTRIYNLSCQAVRFEGQRTLLSRIVANYVLPWCSNAARLWVFKGVLGGQPMLNHLPRDMSKPINKIQA